jgi:hypothetical protein
MITKTLMREADRDSFEGACMYGTFSGQEILEALSSDGAIITIDGDEYAVSMMAPTPVVGKSYELRMEFGCPDHRGYVIFFEKK